MLQATARVEDKGQGDKYRRKELLKKCMSMLRETGSHDVLVDRCCAILQNDVSYRVHRLLNKATTYCHLLTGVLVPIHLLMISSLIVLAGRTEA